MGLKIALKIFDHAKGIIGIEDNKPEAIRICRKLQLLSLILKLSH